MRIVVSKNSSGAAQAVYVGDNGDDALAAAASALRADPALRFFQTINPPLFPLRVPVEASVTAEPEVLRVENPRPKSKAKSP